MPTIRITEKTWENLNRVAKEFLEYKRTGFESVLRLSPDATIQRLIDDWDDMDKSDNALFEKLIRERNTQHQGTPRERQTKGEVKQ